MDIIEEIRTNDLLRARLAKHMTMQCFRNTRLEDLLLSTSQYVNTKH